MLPHSCSCGVAPWGGRCRVLAALERGQDIAVEVEHALVTHCRPVTVSV